MVLKPELANAVMAGVSEHQIGTRAAVTGHWMGLHDTATGSVSLLDKTGNAVLWSGEAGGRSIIYAESGGRSASDAACGDLRAVAEVRRPLMPATEPSKVLRPVRRRLYARIAGAIGTPSCRPHRPQIVAGI